MRILKITIALLALLTTGSALSQSVYKWVDDKGVVNYTTTPPPASKRVSAVDVAPAVQGKATAGEAETRYWQERAAREAANDMALARQRRETEALAQEKLRTELVAAEKKSAHQTAVQAAIDRCKSERRIDCDANPHGTGSYATGTYVYTPIVVVANRTSLPQPTGPYFSVTSNFTPGFSKPLIVANPR